MLKNTCFHIIKYLHNHSFEGCFNVNKILNHDNKRKSIIKFQKMKISNEKINESLNSAAVLIPLCIVDNQLSLLYTLRSTELKNYRGHVSFPGGHKDPDDGNLEETMYRETFEELGISRDDIDLWTQGNFILAKNGQTRLLPFLGFLGEIQPEQLRINKSEVESVFTISLSKLSDPKLTGCTHFHNYVLPVYFGGMHRVWGLTAVLTHITLKCLILDGSYNLNLNPIPKLIKLKDKQL